MDRLAYAAGVDALAFNGSRFDNLSSCCCVSKTSRSESLVSGRLARLDQWHKLLVDEMVAQAGAADLLTAGGHSGRGRGSVTASEMRLRSDSSAHLAGQRCNSFPCPMDMPIQPRSDDFLDTGVLCNQFKSKCEATKSTCSSSFKINFSSQYSCGGGRESGSSCGETGGCNAEGFPFQGTRFLNSARTAAGATAQTQSCLLSVAYPPEPDCWSYEPLPDIAP
mgnify:CR=1 FL=1